MTFAEFSNKIKNFVLSLEQKRRLYIAICSIVDNVIKQSSIKVPQTIDCNVTNTDITGATFDAAKADISTVKRQVYALTDALIAAGVIKEDSTIE